MKLVTFSTLSLSLILLLGACGGGKVDESSLPTRVPTLSAAILTPQPIPTTAPISTATPIPTEPATTSETAAPSVEITPTATAILVTATAATSAGQTITSTQAITNTPESTPSATPVLPTSPEITVTATAPAEVTPTEEVAGTVEVTNSTQSGINSVPTETPSEIPTEVPTATPTEIPTEVPTETPTTAPSPTINATTPATTTTELTPATPTVTGGAAAGEAPSTVDPALAGLPADILAAMKNANPERGKQLTATNACIGCHSLDPNVKLVGPTWNDLATTAEHRVPGMSSGLYLYTSIIHPNDYVVAGYPPGVMLQTYGSLPAQDIADLISFLLTLKEHP